MSVRLGEVSTCRRLKMQCLYVAGTLTECPLMRGLKCSVCMWLGP